jgi:hypothetical protein
MTPPRYLPPDLVARMRHVLPPDLPADLRALVYELVEDGYSWGYVDGCDRGADAGYVPAPLLRGDRRVGTAEVRVNGPLAATMAAHPSGRRSNGHALQDDTRAPTAVTPLRIGQIGEDIARDRLDTDRLDPNHD